MVFVARHAARLAAWALAVESAYPSSLLARLAGGDAGQPSWQSSRRSAGCQSTAPGALARGARRLPVRVHLARAESQVP